MNKRGPKPKGKVKIKWSSNFAYAIGLIATDGCLYRDGRHINLTSKDIEQINNFQKSLGINFNIGRKSNGYNKVRKYYVVQIGDVKFYEFLISIGITPAKSKTLGQVTVPKEYFFDFLRGVLDGDGYVHSYFDPRWKSSFLWYLGFCSASLEFLSWIRSELRIRLRIEGHITMSKRSSCMQLKYAKTEAAILVKYLYCNKKSLYLSRKRLKIKKILAIVDELRGSN